MVKSAVDAAARAIASQPRRDLLDRLARGPATMSELAEVLDVSLPAVDKHLRVLRDADLVATTKSGRSTVARLQPGSLDDLAAWAMSTRLMWSNALTRLEQHLAGPAEPPPAPTGASTPTPPTPDETHPTGITPAGTTESTESAVRRSVRTERSLDDHHHHQPDRPG